MRCAGHKSTLAATLLASAILIIGGTSLPAYAEEASGKIIMGSWGGGTGDAWRESFGAPFTEENGIEVEIVELPSPRAAIISAGGESPYNAAIATYFEAADLYQQGLIKAFDPEDIPGIDRIPEEYWLTNEEGQVLGVGVYFVYYGIAYNSDFVSGDEFASWEALGDPKWRDQLAVNRPIFGASYDLTMFAKVNGGDESNIEPGIPLYEAAAANGLTSYTSMAHMNQLISRGEVVAGPYYSSRVWDLQREGQPVEISIPEEGGLMLPYMVVVPEGSPDLEAAIEFLSYITQPDRQLDAMERTGFIPLNPEVELGAELLDQLGMSVSELQARLYSPDWNVIAANYQDRVEMVEQIIATAR